MRATLTALTFDPLGVVHIDALPTSDAGETRRRMNRIATLDGGAVVNDFGYSEADRTIVLRWRPMGPEREAIIDTLVRLYSRLRLSIPAGCYLVAPETYKPAVEESTLTLLVLEKLA